jgi:predicted nucleic acid-binding Zn ribbon protein
MPRYDFKCATCGFTASNWRHCFDHEEEDAMVHEFKPAPVAPCECGGAREKQPSAPNFVINGYNAKNGYSK